jgi:long-subunit acyl-CoA synthetase (AMP-forming)
MSRLMAALREHAATRPGQAALQDEIAAVSYGELLKKVEHLSALATDIPRALGLLAENSCAWVLADLEGALRSKAIHRPWIIQRDWGCTWQLLHPQKCIYQEFTGS